MQNAYGASPVIQHSVIKADEYGIFISFSSTAAVVVINHSQIYAPSATIKNANNFATSVGASLLSGGAVSITGGTVTCAGVYDEGYAFYASTCP